MHRARFVPLRRLFASLSLFVCAVVVAACSNQPPDWNTLTAARLRDQLPNAQITPIDANTLQASLNGKTTRIDTADLQVHCNRGPKDCDYAFDQLVIQLRGDAPAR